MFKTILIDWTVGSMEHIDAATLEEVPKLSAKVLLT